MKNGQNPEQFYDSLAGEYDEMTDLEVRFLKERPIFQSLVSKYNIMNALDAGCGTGFHSVLLAQLGLQITAIDISEHMLQITQNNAKRKDVHVETVRTSFADIPKKVKNIYDVVFCLGNSLPHILEESELLDSLKGFHKVVKPGGQIFIQMLNFNRIMKNRERIQNIREVNGKIFVRFYDYLEQTILFNILAIQKQKGKMEHSIRSVEIHPWLSADLLRNFRSAGYQNIRLFCNMMQDTYQELSSTDMVIVAQ